MSQLSHFTAYNDEMQQIARQFGVQLRSEWGLAVSESSANGLKSALKANAGKRHGVVDRIGAKFPRHGIYRMYGAGKGMGGSVGSSWITKTGARKRTSATSRNKMGTGNRRPANWLAPTLDKFNELVADRAAAHFAIIGQQIVLSSVPETNKRL